MAEIKLQSPLKWGTTRTGWHHELQNLNDLLRCVTQGFGAKNPAYDQFGLIGHNGLDIALENGDEIYASHDGIAYTSIDSFKGKGVTVVAPGIKTIYWHDLEFKVQNGQQVKKGDLIALGDSTGFSTGPHLHYALKLLDNAGEVLNRDNGYDGCVDPTPYLVWFDGMKFELKQVPGSPEVWLVRNGKKTHIYDPDALLLVADFADVQAITPDALDAIPESGFELSALVKR